MAVPNNVTVPRKVLPEVGDVIHTSLRGQAEVAGKEGDDAGGWGGAGRAVGRRVGVAFAWLVASTSTVATTVTVGVSAKVGEVEDGAMAAAATVGVSGTGVSVAGLVGNMIGVILRSTKTTMLPLSPFT